MINADHDSPYILTPQLVQRLCKMHHMSYSHVTSRSISLTERCAPALKDVDGSGNQNPFSSKRTYKNRDCKWSTKCSLAAVVVVIVLSWWEVHLLRSHVFCYRHPVRAEAILGSTESAIQIPLLFCLPVIRRAKSELGNMFIIIMICAAIWQAELDDIWKSFVWNQINDECVLYLLSPSSHRRRLRRRALAFFREMLLMIVLPQVLQSALNLLGKGNEALVGAATAAAAAPPSGQPSISQLHSCLHFRISVLLVIHCVLHRWSACNRLPDSFSFTRGATKPGSQEACNHPTLRLDS